MGALRGGQTSGTIAPVKYPKPHVCKLPLTWFHKRGTLYRCGGCGEVYILDKGQNFYGDRFAEWNWAGLDGLDGWLDRGGSR